MRQKAIIAALIVWLLIAGVFFWQIAENCKPIAREEVPGTYVANFGNPPETIEIKADGKYLHHFEEKGKREVESNDWTLDSDGAELRVTFTRFSKRDAWLDRGGAIGYWPPTIARHFGAMRLAASADRDLYFEKKDDSQGNR